MSHKAIFAKYLKELSTVAMQGDAREESFYPALADSMTTFGRQTATKTAW